MQSPIGTFCFCNTVRTSGTTVLELRLIPLMARARLRCGSRKRHYFSVQVRKCWKWLEHSFPINPYPSRGYLVHHVSVAVQ